MAIYGPFYPGTATSTVRSGTNYGPWSSPQNVKSNDDLYATGNLEATTKTTDYLDCSGFGIALGLGEKVKSVTVHIEARTRKLLVGINYLPMQVCDETVQLLIDGSGTGNNLARPSELWNTDNWEVRTYGPDGWGVTPTASQIIADNFGVRIAAKGLGTLPGQVANIDYVAVYVETEAFTAPLPPNTPNPILYYTSAYEQQFPPPDPPAITSIGPPSSTSTASDNLICRDPNDTVYRRFLTSLLIPAVDIRALESTYSFALSDSMKDSDYYLWRAPYTITDLQHAVIEVDNIEIRRASSEWDFFHTTDPVWIPGNFYERDSGKTDSSKVIYLRNIENIDIILELDNNSKVYLDDVIVDDSIIYYKIPDAYSGGYPESMRYVRISAEIENPMVIFIPYEKRRVPEILIRYKSKTKFNQLDGNLILVNGHSIEVKAVPIKNRIDAIASQIGVARAGIESNTRLYAKALNAGDLLAANNIQSFIADSLGTLLTGEINSVYPITMPSYTVIKGIDKKGSYSEIPANAYDSTYVTKYREIDYGYNETEDSMLGQLDGIIELSKPCKLDYSFSNYTTESNAIILTENVYPDTYKLLCVLDITITKADREADNANNRIQLGIAPWNIDKGCWENSVSYENIESRMC